MTWIGRQPVYAAHFVVLVFVVSMILTAVLGSANPIWGWFVFDSGAVLRGEVWRIFTYGLYNPPDLWFAIDMLMLVWFGREVEKFLGRRSFLRLFACLYLLSPLLFTVLGSWFPLTLAGQTGAFAIFIAFATLYPGAVMFFGLLAWWVAAILVGLYTLMALGSRNITALISLWSTCGLAYAYIRHAQGRWHLALPRRSRSGRRATRVVVQDPALDRPDATRAEIDALLDKIAANGIASLTPQERARLESARTDLLKRTDRRPR
jgi:hypothetical protein